MAIIEKFLCWPNTRIGSAICGYYTLIISVVCLGFYLFRYIALDAISKSREFRGIVYAGFVLYSLLIGSSLILLPGVYMDKRYLMLPWIYVLVVTILYETGAVALLTTVHLEYEKTLEPWEIISVCFYMFRLVANCYCFACVVSQYQELTEGRGTYDFLYKQPRSPVSNDDVYSPPQGASLPPYSYEDQHKEYSPPNYDNLSFRDDNGVIYRNGTSDCLYNECRQNRMVNDVMDCCVHADDCCVDVPDYYSAMTLADNDNLTPVTPTSQLSMTDKAEITSLSVDFDTNPEFDDASSNSSVPVIRENSERNEPSSPDSACNKVYEKVREETGHCNVNSGAGFTTQTMNESETETISSMNYCAQEIATSSNEVYNKEHNVLGESCSMVCDHNVPSTSSNHVHKVLRESCRMVCDHNIPTTSSNHVHELFKSGDDCDRQINMTSLNDVYNIEHGVLQATLSGSSLTKPVGGSVLVDGDYQKTTHLTWI